MFDILKKQFKIGDTIKITLTNSKEVAGVINDWGDNYIIIEDVRSKKKVTVFDKMIGMWEQIDNQVSNSEKIHLKEIEPKEKIETKDEPINLIGNPSQETKEKKQGKKVEKTIEKNEKKRKIGLKVIGKIDVAELDKQKRREEIKKAKAKYKSSNKAIKNEITAQNLNDLVNILKPEFEKENEKTIPANGVLYRFFGDRSFGFIRDKFNYELYFNYREVLDKTLLNSLVGTATRASIPVLFTLQKMGDKERAIFVQKPKKIKEVLAMTENLIKDRKFDTASGVVGQILEAFPNNFSANQLKDEIEKKRFKPRYRKKNKSYSYDLNYRNAKIAKDNKDYNKAIGLFHLALENKEKIESAIKDLAQTYLEIGEIEKGIEVIEKYIDELPPITTTYNFLDHYYTSAKNFKKAIEYIDKNLELVGLNDKKTYARLLTKKAFCFIQLKDFDEAEELLEEAISIQPTNTYATNLLNALTTASSSGDYDEVDKLIEETEFISFSSGISSFLKKKLSDSELLGLKAAVIESRKFEKKHLYELRDLIKGAGRARPRERAGYLITEAKLLLELFPEKEDELRSVLARYCNAMALANIYEKEEKLDLIRFFYLEAFGLEENWNSLVRQVVVFLNTYIMNHKELIEVNAKEKEKLEGKFLDSTIEKILVKRRSNWEGLINSFLSSRIITTEVLKRIHKKNNLRNIGIEYLKNEGILEKENSYPSIDSFLSAWNKVIQKRQREIKRWFASIKSISNLDSIEVITNQIQSTLLEAKADWLPQVDTFRLNIIADDISEIIETIFKSNNL